MSVIFALTKYGELNAIYMGGVNLDISAIKDVFQPKITDEQLWDFYVRNDICEVGFEFVVV